MAGFYSADVDQPAQTFRMLAANFFLTRDHLYMLVMDLGALQLLAIAGAADALLLQAWFDPSFDPLRTAKEFMEVVLRGLRRPAGGG